VSQRTDIEIVDSSSKGNVCLSKRNIKGETRLAITTHEDGEVGVCLSNYLEQGELRSFMISIVP
jgi:putative aminopeptidase FrvX